MESFWYVVCTKMHNLHTIASSKNVQLIKGYIDRMGIIQILMHDGFYIRKVLGVINEG